MGDALASEVNMKIPTYVAKDSEIQKRMSRRVPSHLGWLVAHFVMNPNSFLIGNEEMTIIRRLAGVPEGPLSRVYGRVVFDWGLSDRDFEVVGGLSV